MVSSVLSLSAVASMFPSLMLRPSENKTRCFLTSFPGAEVREVGGGEGDPTREERVTPLVRKG